MTYEERIRLFDLLVLSLGVAPDQALNEVARMRRLIVNEAHARADHDAMAAAIPYRGDSLLERLLMLVSMHGKYSEQVNHERSIRVLAVETARADRDQARAELAGVAAQRDAHLSRSVELAARITELEAKLATMTPAVDEAGGFKVGDLVRNLLSAPCIAWGRVTRVGRHVEVTYPTNREAIAYKPDELCRKLVGVGDMVRIIEGTHAGLTGVVDGVIGGEARVIVDPGASLSEARWVTLPRLVAVAPTVKP